MLLVWLHGAELAGTSPAKELYQALISTGNSKAAGTQKETSLHSCFTFLCRMTKTMVASVSLTSLLVPSSSVCYIIHEQDSNPDTFPAWPHCFHGTTSAHWLLGCLPNMWLIWLPLFQHQYKGNKLSKTDPLCLADKIRMEEEKDKSKNCNISWE